MAILHEGYSREGTEEKQISEIDKKILGYIEAENCARNFDRAICRETDWRVYYQLSSCREDLFSWYPFRENCKVLEIGAGFGGLTGSLCNRCGKVVATERSEIRAKGLAKRYANVENLDIYVGDIRAISLEETFDYVILVGVLERLAEPAEYLGQVRKYLKPDGRLLVAADNRFGLRYFCGAVDWHSGKAFGGITQYERGETGGRSVSRSELQEMLGKAGFGGFQFYYPLPDYRFPAVVYSDVRLPRGEEAAAVDFYNIRRDTLLADEKKVYKEVVENGGFPFMANSFLAECSCGETVTDVSGREEGVFHCIMRRDNTKLPAQWFECCEKRMEENALRLVSEAEKIANYQVSDKMKKIWKVELEILDEIDCICRKHQLTYFLVHGSLLGAVRHKGFIPWDDDLDLAMPREDYEKFIALAKAELSSHLALYTPQMQKDIFWGGHTRVCNKLTTAIEARNLRHKGDMGIWVDILPFDPCTMDEKRMERKQRKIRHCHRLLNAKVYGKDYRSFCELSPIKWGWYRLLASLSSHERLCDKLDKAIQLFGEDKTEDIAFFSGYYKHRRLNAKDFAEAVLLDFAGRKVPAPKGYEKYLFMTMGKDYMEYPPEEQRKPKHAGIYDPEKPYSYYQKMLNDTFADVKGKQIILFGTGMMFEDYMKKYGEKYRPAFLVDNDDNKWGRNRMGIGIKEPKAILEVPEKKRHLIICSYYYKEIQKQLEEMGIRDYHVYVQHAEWILDAEETGGRVV